MKTTIQKIGSRKWEWNINQGMDHLAGGFSATRGDAETDSVVARQNIESMEARAAGRIVQGDEIQIHPEFQDPGDELYRFFAIETQVEGQTSIRVQAFRDGRPSIGVQSIETKHLI